MIEGREAGEERALQRRLAALTACKESALGKAARLVCLRLGPVERARDARVYWDSVSEVP